MSLLDLKHVPVFLIGLVSVLGLLAPDATAQTRDWQSMKNRLLNEIVQDMRLTSQYTGKDHLSRHVYEAMSRVERHRFVPEAYQSEAYDNHPLPIGSGQTISQPFIVALMTELLEIPERSAGNIESDRVLKVLELGTGSGYQAAVLSEIVDQVYTVEVVKDLAQSAEKRLKRLGYKNIHVKYGDGTLGWPEEAPFDGIIVTAAGVKIPDSLLQQLKTGARLVIPVGGQHEVQQLMVITRKNDGSFSRKSTLPVRFVPITSPAKD